MVTEGEKSSAHGCETRLKLIKGSIVLKRNDGIMQAISLIVFT